MSNTLEQITKGLMQPSKEQPSKIDLKTAGDVLKQISSREPFRVTSIIFFKTDDNQ